MTEKQADTKAPRIELVVMSRPALDGFTPGHIMVAVSHSKKGEQAWGFYPDGVQDEIIMGGWQRYTRSSVIKINEMEYYQLLAAIEKFKKTNEYNLFRNNCISFVNAVLKRAGIDVPEQTFWPDSQGKQYIKKHGEAWGKCLSG
jgi:hypothetical protein